MNLVCAGIRAHDHLACQYPVSLKGLFHSHSELLNRVDRGFSGSSDRRIRLAIVQFRLLVVQGFCELFVLVEERQVAAIDGGYCGAVPLPGQDS